MTVTDWDDDDDVPLKKQPRSTAKSATPVKKATHTNAPLLKHFQQNNKDELIAILLQLCNEYSEVKKQFDREIKQNEELAGDDKLKQKARKIIKETFHTADRSSRYSSRRRYDYDDYATPDFSDLEDFIERLDKHPDPFEIFRWLSLQLLPAVDDWHQEHYVDEDWEFDCLFTDITKAALAKAKPDDVAKYYQWADELAATTREYEYSSSVAKTIEEFAWGKKGLNQFADILRDGLSKKANSECYSYIRRLVHIMVQVERRKELIELLRPLSKQQGVASIFVTQLVEAKMYDEAIERMRVEYIAEAKGQLFGGGWFGQLTALVTQRKNWPLLASLYANELFRKPALDLITGLLGAAKKLGVEQNIRKSVAKYLETGVVPDAVVQTLENKKLGAIAKKHWPLMVFVGDTRAFGAKSRLGLLCDWAISENRPKDAIEWYNKCTSTECEHRAISLAAIIWQEAPNMAIEIYQKAAMKIVDATDRNRYSTATGYLGKVKKLYEQTGRSAEGAAYIEKVRSENKRKPAFIKELDKMNKRM